MDIENDFIENFKALLETTALGFEVDITDNNYLDAIRIIEGRNKPDDINTEAL